MSPNFTVVGAGLAGSLMALFLAEDGYKVELLERRPDPRVQQRVGGRSINLAISERAIHALKEAGLAEEVLAESVPMRGRMMHGIDGSTTFQPYGQDGQHINSVTRDHLNDVLLGAADRHPNVDIRFEYRLIDINFDKRTLKLKTAGDDIEAHPFQSIVGADGAYSAVRGEMQRRGAFDYSQDFLDHGYKELTIPAAPDGGFRIDPNALHIWPRGDRMMIALPNDDGSFTVTIFWPIDGARSFDSIPDGDAAALRQRFTEQYPDVVDDLVDLEADYFEHPIGRMVTIKCDPWHEADKAVLIGDASHAVVPFYGQGANASLEDCVLLRDALRRNPNDRASAFAAFGRDRKDDADALAELALHNFIEMRDHVASPAFLARKELERKLAKYAPDAFQPLYSMVTFSRVPYADAVARSRRQDQLLTGSIGTATAAGLAGLAALLRKAT
jgi:kynurenine 3-monooxygenase